ncbi:hypothetical protein SDC9_179900 [bioreactor metagenome]|uniref:Uncharacterized protein n=1 Tax=bioreactor metagenome TaxID=1076179 RepID=A0A645H250_9ZZZZ
MRVEHRVHAIQEEHQVLVDAEKPYVHDDHQRHHALGRFFVCAHAVDPHAEHPVHEDRREHDQHERGLAPAVEAQAHERQKQVARPAPALQQIVADQREHQKEKQKLSTGKNH